MEGKKVLLVDTDPQASLTVSMGNPFPDELSPTLSDMMGKIITDTPIAPGEGILHHPEGVDYRSSLSLRGAGCPCYERGRKTEWLRTEPCFKR